MKKITYLSLVVILITQFAFSQNTEKEKAEKYIATKGELTFTFKVNNPSELENYSKNLSIINYDPKTKTVIAWANEQEFRIFESLNITYKVPKGENEVDESFIYDNKTSLSKTNQIGKTSANTLSFPVANYPTYAQYAQQMQDFENNYPSLVKKISLGTTTENDGKELLFVKISDNVNTDEQEPKLLLTSSMHGDEIAGYPMMLSLINYILTVYSNPSDPDYARIKNLVENAEIWINPSANPDGTYYGSATNTSVAGSRRANFNSIDLNRNYPDNVAGAHYDGNAYQKETLAFMNLADTYHFVIAANFHGGTEVFNYPFDNAYYNEALHPDNNWFEYVGIEYTTHAQNDSDPFGDTTYMTVDYDSSLYPSPGVTRGAEWYKVFGGRQDYMNFYKQCKEVTIELSDTKILPESQLANYWYYNKNALLDFLTEGTYGFRGVVKDATTGYPIDATVKIVGHDNYGSHTFTDITHGDYYRPIKSGTYDIIYESDCYQSYTLTNQTIADHETKVLPDLLLTPVASAVPTSLTASSITTNSASLSWNSSSGNTFDLRYRQVGSSTWTDVPGLTTSPYALTGLSVSTNYEFQVRSVCSSSTSSYSSSKNFTTTAVSYCSANGNSTADEYIGKVTFGSISNTTGAGSGGYSDFTSISTDVVLNSTYPISITKTWTGTQYSEAIRVWIDYNQDGDFLDSGEQVVNSTASTTTPITANITIPNGASLGTTRMRVALRYNTSPSSCGSFNYGEVEDYTINITSNLSTWYADTDNDTYGDPNVSQQAATQPSGYVSDNTDCDDTDANINPGTVWYAGVDNDNDGFFGSTTSVTQCASPGAGYSTTPQATDDCDDNDANINPGTVWYAGVDNDSDGFFGSTTSVTQCASPGAGYSTTPQATDDCDDNDANINPGTVWYAGVDNDSDGFFGSTTSVTQCASPGAGYSTTPQATDDCDDNDANINPGAVEIIGNSIDEDCDGIAQMPLDNSDFNFKNVSITPNPFNSHITITVPLSFNSKLLNIVIYDINGRYILNQNMSVNSSKININHGLNRLNEGAYFIKITDLESKNTLIKQLIKY
ncbi:hypothetical protein GCM10007962_08740 [Yeosuana aromativorans]|uniref:Secreted protein (Por secretion system target) n=1 Tax=Yeosuana aromativorans TaxID=288019 RepID=A0A8J3BF30_9FLAO|nr:M14 family zinc carboxypeptidase [Yeosuana aromativorans]GGK16708.1 hypothetical protein GCM10007962_08740 [Yeosuana aromativorans]